MYLIIKFRTMYLFYTNKCYSISKKKNGGYAMDNYKKILKYMQENNGIASNLEINKIGIDTKFLLILNQRGQIERASRGVYSINI